MLKRGDIINPEGKGGFADNPQNRANGRWSKETSIAYWQNAFIRMPVLEFETWLDNNPDRTMAQEIAHISVKESKTSIHYQKELSDRTEGKPQTYSDVTSGGEPIKLSINPKEWVE